jgi:hypothetical protein
MLSCCLILFASLITGVRHHDRRYAVLEYAVLGGLPVHWVQV